MLNIILSADWALSAADMDWFCNSYFRAMYGQALANIAFADIALTFYPNSMGLVDLRVGLHPTTWLDATGRGDAGLYSPPTADDPTHRIEIAWDREMASHVPLQHEICHFLLLANAIACWDVFQHGMNAPTPMFDKYLVKLLEIGRRAYWKGHSSDPFKLIDE